MSPKCERRLRGLLLAEFQRKFYPAYARGPGSQWVRGSVEQHTLYWIMQAALDGLNPLPPEPPKAKKSWIPKIPKLKLPKLPFGK